MAMRAEKLFEEHSSVAELERRQLTILLLIIKLETTMACYDDNGSDIAVPNCNAFHYNEKGTSSKVFAIEDGGHNATCNPLVSRPQNNISEFHEYGLPTSLNQDQSSESRMSSGCRPMAIKMRIVGEPLEKLFRWGHSTCVEYFTSSKSLIIFGGYGGRGRHSRQNDSLLLDTESGNLKTLNVKDPPNPRMGHTALFVGQHLYIIGGREDPTRILSEVWFLHVTELKWHMVEFSGEVLPPRHRHAAAVVGSCIYVFGGIHGFTIYGDMHVLDTNIMEWKQVEAKGEIPCARHSHSLAVRGTKIYLFGGYDGSRILGDLYTFDVETCFWNEVETIGRKPGPKFSHSMVVFDNYLAVIGGCPLTGQFQQFALLDLELLVWRRVSISSISDYLLVRSTANVVGNELVIIGGGCSCYAFGTKFNETFKLDLRLLIFSEQGPWLNRNDDTAQQVRICKTNATNEKDSDKHFPACTISNASGENDKNKSKGKCPESFISPINMSFLFSKLGTKCEDDQKQKKGETIHRNNRWILQVDKFSAKLAKDALKKLGWLDMSRKARVIKQGSHICFPITEDAVFFFHRKNFRFIDKMKDHSSMDIGESSVEKLRNGVSKNNVSVSALLDVMNSCHVTVAEGDACSRSKELKAPQEVLREAVALLIKQKGVSPSILDELPSR
ncbi:hypothetical protein KI387_041985, partial [Taxus chinensis]